METDRDQSSSLFVVNQKARRVTARVLLALRRHHRRERSPTPRNKLGAVRPAERKGAGRRGDAHAGGLTCSGTKHRALGRGLTPIGGKKAHPPFSATRHPGTSLSKNRACGKKTHPKCPERRRAQEYDVALVQKTARRSRGAEYRGVALQRRTTLPDAKKTNRIKATPVTRSWPSKHAEVQKKKKEAWSWTVSAGMLPSWKKTGVCDAPADRGKGKKTTRHQDRSGPVSRACASAVLKKRISPNG